MLKDKIGTALAIASLVIWALTIAALATGQLDIFLLSPECTGFFLELPEHCKP